MFNPDANMQLYYKSKTKSKSKEAYHMTYHMTILSSKQLSSNSMK